MSFSRFTKLLLVVSVLGLGCSGPSEPTLNNDTEPTNDNGAVECRECGEILNPTCQSNNCKLPSGGYGLCHLDSKLNCVCGDKDEVTDDPCISINNPQCEAKDCTTEDGLGGKCSKHDSGLCYCNPSEEDPVDRDPCGEKLNPECKAENCKTSSGEEGICNWMTKSASVTKKRLWTQIKTLVAKH